MQFTARGDAQSLSESVVLQHAGCPVSLTSTLSNTQFCESSIFWPGLARSYRPLCFPSAALVGGQACSGTDEEGNTA
eukprot:1049788-Pelagomonas_calceolata.AAC.3